MGNIDPPTGLRYRVSVYRKFVLSVVQVILVDLIQLELLTYFSRGKEKGEQNVLKLAQIGYRISSKKRPGAYFKFQLKGWALIRRRALNRGGAYKANYRTIYSCSWEVYCIYQECGSRTKIKRRQITHKKILCKHIETEITGNDLTEKKLSPSTDSAVVEALKVKNKVAIEAVFPCIPSIHSLRASSRT